MEHRCPVFYWTRPVPYPRRLRLSVAEVSTAKDKGLGTFGVTLPVLEPLPISRNAFVGRGGSERKGEARILASLPESE